MAGRQTHFNSQWLLDKRFSYWVRPVPKDNTMAACLLCSSGGQLKTFNLSTMGVKALESHATGFKHKGLAKSYLTARTNPMEGHMIPPSQQSNTSPRSSASRGDQSSQRDVSNVINPVQIFQSSQIAASLSATRANEAGMALQKMLVNDQVTKAEILWTLNSVCNHTSQRSASKAIPLFQIMFPDSEIASKMQLQRTKLGYYINHGLGPFFLEELRKYLEDSADFMTVGFDESLNKVIQRIQMDLQVRYWSKEKNEVTTRYLTSVFLDHAAASDLLTAFETSLGETLLKKLLQVSMDGPNVNHKFLRELLSKLREFSQQPPVPLDLGSCGLHVLHGAFKKGFEETGWMIVRFLRAIYYFFKNFPGRLAVLASCFAALNSQPAATAGGSAADGSAADGSAAAGSAAADERVEQTKFDVPLKICAMRWLENGPVAKRGSSLLIGLKAYIKKMETDKTAPSSRCYKTFKEALADPLLPAKLAFFSSICDHIEPFLREFQTNAPYAPFLYRELQKLLQTFMEMFVKEDVLNRSSAQSIDVLNEDNLLPAKQIKLSYAVKDEIKKCRSNLKSKDILLFREDCRSALIAMVNKLLEKSPLKQKFTRAIACLDPAVVASDAAVCLKRLSLCLEELVSRRWLSGAAADKVEGQFKKFIRLRHVIVAMQSFRRSETRLDHHWMKLLDAENDEFNEVKFLVRLICTLSHGNAFLERGFSVNRECMVDNQNEQSLVAQRRIYDKISSVGGVEKFEITKSAIHAVRNSHAKYKEYLEKDKKEKLAKSEIERTRKRVAEETKELKEKKLRLLAEANREVALIDEQIENLQ